MAWVKRQSKSAEGESAQAAFTFDSSPLEGSLIVISVSHNDDDGLTFNQSIVSIVEKIPFGGSNQEAGLASKIAGASEVSTFDVDFVGSDRWSIGGIEFTGNHATPIDTPTINSFGSGSAQDPHTIDTSADTAEADELIVMTAFNPNRTYSGEVASAGSATFATAPVEEWEQSGASSSAHLVQCWGVANGTGTYGIATTPASATWGGQLICAFKIASGDIALGVNDLSSAQTTDAVILAVQFALGTNDLSSAQTTDAVILAVAFALAMNDLSNAQAIDAFLVVRDRGLSLNDLSQAQAADAVALTADFGLGVNDLSQAQTIDAITLAAQFALSLDAVDQAQAVDAIALVVSIALSLDDLSSAQTTDAIALIVSIALGLNDLSSAQTADAITLAAQFALLLDAVDQAQAIDAITLAAQFALAVDNPSSAQAVDAIVLAAQFGLSLDAVDQGQTADAILLSADFGLSINGLSSAQVVSLISLVIGGGNVDMRRFSRGFRRGFDRGTV